MDSSLFSGIWLILLPCNALRVFNFNSTHHPPLVDGKPIVKCEDKSGCQFNCRGHDSCFKAEFHCYDGSKCNLFCDEYDDQNDGRTACGRSKMHCPNDAECEISLNGFAAMYLGGIYAESSSSLTINGKGDASMNNMYIKCPKHSSSSKCMVRLIGDSATDYHYGVLQIAPQFYMDDVSDLQFECNGVKVDDYSELFGAQPFEIWSHEIQYMMKYDHESHKLVCTNNESFVLTHNKCNPTTSSPTQNDDKSMKSWQLASIIVTIVVVCLLSAAFVGYELYNYRNAHERRYSHIMQANEFEASDGDDSMMLIIKKSMNEQQQL